MPAPTVLMTGSCGLLGSHLAAALAGRYRVVGVDRHPWWGDQPMAITQADLTAPGAAKAVVAETGPEIVIHCAAMVNVDACEADPARAYACNEGLTRELVRATPPRSLFLYISTDAVFQGDRALATEETLPCPRNVYGRSKLHGEWEVQQGGMRHLIVRTNFYGWSSGRKESAAEWLYRSLKTRQPMTLFTDVFFTPIYVVDLVERLVRLVEVGAQGIVHLGGGERVSKHRFGVLLAETAGFSMDTVRQGSVDAGGLLAPRAKEASLSSERFARLTGMPVPDCRAGLTRFIADALRPLSARVAEGAASWARG